MLFIKFSWLIKKRVKELLLSPPPPSLVLFLIISDKVVIRRLSCCIFYSNVFLPLVLIMLMSDIFIVTIPPGETEASAAISNDNVLKVVQDHEESTSSIEGDSTIPLSFTFNTCNMKFMCDFLTIFLGSSQQPKHTKLEPALSSLQLQKDSRLEQNKKTHLSQDTTTDQEMIASQQNLVDPGKL